MANFGRTIPILRFYEESATKDFYLDFLGFDPLFEFRFEPDTPLYFGVQCGDTVLHLSGHYGDGTPGTRIRIEHPDVHAFCAELNAKRFAFARPGVQSQPWGYDDMAISDPAGNVVIFGTPHRAEKTD